jgi:hypothetical protein
MFRYASVILPHYHPINVVGFSVLPIDVSLELITGETVELFTRLVSELAAVVLPDTSAALPEDLVVVILISGLTVVPIISISGINETKPMIIALIGYYKSNGLCCFVGL